MSIGDSELAAAAAAAVPAWLGVEADAAAAAAEAAEGAKSVRGDASVYAESVLEMSVSGDADTGGIPRLRGVIATVSMPSDGCAEAAAAPTPKASTLVLRPRFLLVGV